MPAVHLVRVADSIKYFAEKAGASHEIQNPGPLIKRSLSTRLSGNDVIGPQPPTALRDPTRLLRVSGST